MRVETVCSGLGQTLVYEDSGWELVAAGFTDQVWTIHESRDGVLWAGGSNFLWRYEDSGWQRQTRVTGEVNVILAIHENSDGTLWIGADSGL